MRWSSSRWRAADTDLSGWWQTTTTLQMNTPEAVSTPWCHSWRQCWCLSAISCLWLVKVYKVNLLCLFVTIITEGDWCNSHVAESKGSIDSHNFHQTVKADGRIQEDNLHLWYEGSRLKPPRSGLPRQPTMMCKDYQCFEVICQTCVLARCWLTSSFTCKSSMDSPP